MAQPSQETPAKPRQVNALGLAGLVFIGLLAGSLGSRLWTEHAPAQSSKLADAVHAYQSGDERSAVTLLKPLADGKDAKAEYWLADIYLDDGQGPTADKTKAVALLQKSADQGFVPAQGRLGEIYLNGDDTLQDFTKAQDWLHKAAVAGDVRAQRLLGHTYEIGLGVKQDLAQAYGWYENAALGSNVLAQRMRDSLVARMSPTEVAQGEQDAKATLAEIKASVSQPLVKTKTDTRS